jgi:hypothetical protein
MSAQNSQAAARRPPAIAIWARASLAVVDGWLARLPGGRASAAPPARVERDLRLDFFRGLALFFIFIDHIPNNILSNVTLRTIAFSDAAEVFIFISGYTAALVYGQYLVRRGPLFATVQIYHRVWQLYAAHIFIFVIYTAEVSYATLKLQTQTYSEELRLNNFLQEPHVAIIKTLLLQYQPELLDILPLYIVLLAAFPVILLLQHRWPIVPLILSAAIYVLTLRFDLEPRSYPSDSGWFFNPLAWQFLFVVGATAGYAQSIGLSGLPHWHWLWRAALGVTVVVAVIKITWTLHEFVPAIPALLHDALDDYSEDKTNLSPLRLLSFFVLALTTVHFVRRDSAFLRHPVARLVVLCGQHSLQVFCLGILLSVLGRFIINSISQALAMQLAVNFAGIALMIALAKLLSWYKQKSRESAAAPVPRTETAG